MIGIHKLKTSFKIEYGSGLDYSSKNSFQAISFGECKGGRKLFRS
jgi:hypothetical protein